jgi:hypothetical protein
VRITQRYLEELLKTVSAMGKWPQGPYPTHGSLLLSRTNGRYQLCMLLASTGEVSISNFLTASEMEEFLRGMIAAYDASRFQAHWKVGAE